MAKLLGIALSVWLILFTFRVVQIGGIDPTYREEGSQVLQPLRDYLTETLDQNLPYPQSAILSGILLGADKNLPFSLKNDLKATSTIHLIVVSGQNLTMVAGFILNLASFLGRKKTLFLALATIFFYSLLTGLEVPVVRAAIMVTLAYMAQVLGKERLGLWILLLTAAGMLLFNPNWLLSISFQLSFLATLGVVLVAPLFIERLRKVPSVFREDLGVTLAAQLMVLPVIAYNFNQLSLFGILVNTLILWTVPLVMISGFLVLGLGLVSSILGQVAGLFPSALLTYFIYIVEFFAKISGAGVRVGESSLMLWVGYYLLVGAGVWVISKSQNSKHKSQI